MRGTQPVGIGLPTLLGDNNCVRWCPECPECPECPIMSGMSGLKLDMDKHGSWCCPESVRSCPETCPDCPIMAQGSGWVGWGLGGHDCSARLGRDCSGRKCLGRVGRLDPLVGHDSCLPGASSGGECVAEQRQDLSDPVVPTRPGPQHDCMILTTCNGMSPHVPRTP